ncbi:AAA family ATPase [Amphritea atlantica]|uniref:AAA family ATPase n=1 Tax=Amphritea atlantica TaxID=355243 RepID=A0ABY5GSV4_9GAMM|nr:AAA family ATPase [Amphritea atlantica]
MHLRISRIDIKNFKVFEEISIHPNSAFNIIIGENSAGKSTIFEALHLWEKCYQTYILSSRKGFYKVRGTNNRYVNYQELDFLRITKDDDLFFHPGRGTSTCAEVSLILSSGENDYELGFKISRPTSIENAFLRVQPINEDQFSSFAEAFTGAGRFLDEAVFIYQTRPVSGVHQFEPYFNEAQVKKRIQRGLSHEVLRNKIVVRRDSIEQLSASISEILEREVKFELPARGREKKDEYVSLKVSLDDGNKHDLHLQGSGFLQIVEILSTIEFVDAPLKLLLVDEPDSHIHSKLQQNLISHLRRIDHNQFFVISHNDQFVTNAGDDEIFFLNDDAKREHELKAINSDSFDIIKNSLGGVVLSLEKLNRSENVVFVEGSDDVTYITDLAAKVSEITNGSALGSKNTFFPLRGKDNILSKIEYNKRTLSSLFKDKRWGTIFDRDFSTDQIDADLRQSLLRKMGRGTPFAFSHDGYCIESVLFSDQRALVRMICRTNDRLDQECVETAVNDFFDSVEASLRDITSDLYSELRGRFASQKRNRTEFQELEFDQVVREWLLETPFPVRHVMSKPLILAFCLEVELQLGSSILMRHTNSEEGVSSGLFNMYINTLQALDELIPSLRELLTSLNYIAPPGEN